MNCCPNCKKEFVCGAQDSTPCWCTNLPNIVPMDSKECLCQSCLEQKIKALQKINIENTNTVFEPLKKLKSDAKPLFGVMTPQHMIEHLIFTLSFSNGKLIQPLMVDERKAKVIRYYTIHTDSEMSIGFKAPMLGDEPLPLIYANLEEAIDQLKKEFTLFDEYFKTNPDSKPVCPVIGELNHKEWIIFHNKHFTHHFKQFGLM